MIKIYHTHKPQTNQRYSEEEPQSINRNKTLGRQLKQSNQLSLPCQDETLAALFLKKWASSWDFDTY